MERRRPVIWAGIECSHMQENGMMACAGGMHILHHVVITGKKPISNVKQASPETAIRFMIMINYTVTAVTEEEIFPQISVGGTMLEIKTPIEDSTRR